MLLRMLIIMTSRTAGIILVITTIVKRHIWSSPSSSNFFLFLYPQPFGFPSLLLPFRAPLLWCTVVYREVSPMDSLTSTANAKKTDGTPSSRETLTVTDNRTGKSYDLPITHGTIRAMDLRQIKTDSADFGMMSYDPAYNNTASCISRITYIDGDQGILRYRGYPIEELAEKSTYLETAYLLLYGELPTEAELDKWVFDITHHTII